VRATVSERPFPALIRSNDGFHIPSSPLCERGKGRRELLFIVEAHGELTTRRNASTGFHCYSTNLFYLSDHGT
jgi:hypothetical protein